MTTLEEKAIITVGCKRENPQCLNCADFDCKGQLRGFMLGYTEAKEHHADELQKFRDRAVEAYKLNCRNYTACCFDQKPCTADCEYLGDFISKLNEE